MEEIYARGGIGVGGVKRAEGSFETMGFKWRFFLPFFSLLKRKGNIPVKVLSLRQKSSIFATSLVTPTAVGVRSATAEGGS